MGASNQSSTFTVLLVLLSMTSGFASLIGSSTIIFMIFRSTKKLADPYRRIVFGISFFDVLQSLSHVLVVFKTDPDESPHWTELGNHMSCQLLGFMQFAGQNGALSYSLALNIFYLCLVKYNITRDKYRNRIEPFLLGIPILWAMTSASIIVGTGHMNPSFASFNHKCYISPYPANCLGNPDVQCIRGKNTILYRILFHTVPILIVYLGILLILGILWWTVVAQEQKMNKYRTSRSEFTIKAAGNVLQQNSPPCTEDQEEGSQLSLWQSFCNMGRSRREREQHLLQRRGREFLIQAVWYTVAFLLTYSFPVVFGLMRMIAPSKPVSKTLIALLRFFAPLQGLMNILVYTRLHVAKERMINPSLTWFCAFKKVIKSGGDDDLERTNRLRRGSTTLNEARYSSTMRRDGTVPTTERRRSRFFAPLVGLFSRIDESNGGAVECI